MQNVYVVPHSIWPQLAEWHFAQELRELRQRSIL